MLCTWQTLLKLLGVWSDVSAVKHTAYEQHLYVTKALIVCAVFMTEAHLQQLQSGIERHLCVCIKWFASNADCEILTYMFSLFLSVTIKHIQCTSYGMVFADILSRMMAGVQVHLDSSVHGVRRLGMITAEILSERLNISQEKLQFEVTIRMLFLLFCTMLLLMVSLLKHGYSGWVTSYTFGTFIWSTLRMKRRKNWSRYFKFPKSRQ